MARTAGSRNKPKVAAPVVPQHRFIIVNTDCNNVEGYFKSMPQALDEVTENIDPEGREWNADDIFILEVVAVHSVRTAQVESEIEDIARLDGEF